MRDTLSQLLSSLDILAPEAAEMKSRMHWAPALSNGGAMLALAGIVGNANNQDAALTALTGPLACFAVGMALGASALYANNRYYDAHRALVLQARGCLITFDDATTRMAENHRELDELKAIVAGRRRDTDYDKVERMMAEMDERLGSLTADQQTLELEAESMSKSLKSQRRLTTIAPVLERLSIAVMVLGFAILLIGHARGWLRLAG